MAQFGIPYLGSKGSICKELVKVFPKYENFYDLFGGGFSVTHAMLLKRSRDFKEFHFNEIRPGICELIQKAINGDFNYNKFKPPWVSREEFFTKVETDPMIKILWSFGNNGRGYLFGKDIEPYKKSMHNAIVFNKFDDLAKAVFKCNKFADGYSIQDRRLFLGNKIEFYRLNGGPKELKPFIKNKDATHHKQLERLQQLQQLERLQQLEQLEQLERLHFYNTSYEKVPIKPNSIIYCDPPYSGTAKYDGVFDHGKFLNWCDAQGQPVFISEYQIKDDRFTPIFTIQKRSMLSSDMSVGNKTEMVYANKAGKALILENNKRAMLDKSR